MVRTLFFGWLTMVLSLTALAASPYRVAVFADPDFPTQDSYTPGETILKVLTEEGVEGILLDVAQLADPHQFNADRFELLIVATGEDYPLDAKETLLSFLRQGGDLLCSGGYAFDDPLIRKNGQWISSRILWEEEEARGRDPQVAGIPNGGFESGSDGWTTVQPTHCQVVQDEAFSGSASASVICDKTESGARWEGELPVKAGGYYLIGAHAKVKEIHGNGYGYLAVYQYDAQGQLLRFIDFAQMWKSSDWQRYEQSIEIDPKAVKVMFYGGLYLTAGSLCFDDVTCAEIPRQNTINAHFGKAGDGLVNTADQLPLFSPDQRFQGNSLVLSPQAPIEMEWNSTDDVIGFEATAQIRYNARWIPFVDALDEWGRFSGSAGAFVDHFRGPYAGSRWVLFGIENRDVFEGEAGKRLLSGTVRRLRSGIFALPLETQYASYHQGEEIQIRFPLQNSSRDAQTVELELRFQSPDNAQDLIASITRTIALPAQSQPTEHFVWSLPDVVPNFVEVTGILRVENEMIDRIQTGFSVRDDSVIANGPRLRYAENAFHLSKPDGSSRKVSLWGTDTYGNYFSPPAHSPLTWFRELQSMRNGGLHLFENLQWIPKQYRVNENQWRQLDALIQLSQRFDLAYMTGLLIGQNIVVDEDELQAQAEMCRQFAQRYKHVPGLIYYLNGDFQLNLKDTPDIRGLWNDFLRERYSSSDALRIAWKTDVPDLGEVPVTDAPAQNGYDVRTRDTAEFKIQLMKRWIETLCQAIRSEDREHPITSEYYQKPISGIDLRLTLGSMDAANFGYFDRPQWDIARMMAVVKWNDMRRYGKTVNMGEFGVKTHEAWAVKNGGSHYHIQRTEREQQELFWWVAHIAWGMGVTKIQNWCWSDDPNTVFPWGVVWNNPLRAKPVMKLFRNLRLLSDRMPIEYHPSSTVLVMPDHFRLGTLEHLSHTSLLNAMECLLAANGDFDTVSEFDLDFLDTETPQWIMAPLAYAMSDETLHRLKKAAERGAQLYLSGDISLKPNGERDPSRLEWLCGVRQRGEVESIAGLPFPRVEPSGAEPMNNPAGLPLYQQAVGQGRILYSPEPWEILSGIDLFVDHPETSLDPSKNLYCSLFSLSSSVQFNEGVWRITETPTGDNTWVAIYPRQSIKNAQQVEVNSSGTHFQFTVHDTVPSGVLVNAKGQALAATGSGDLRVGGETWVQCEGPWMIVSLDEQGIHESRQLIVCSMDGGRIQWKTQSEDLKAVVVDWQDGQAFSTAPISIVDAGNECQIEVSPNELYLVAPSSDLQNALERLNF